MNRSRRSFVTQIMGGVAIGVPLLRDSWLQTLQAAQQRSVGQAPEAVAGDEDFWIQIQQAFDVDRSVINLNNGGVAPSPRIVQAAYRRHIEYANGLPARRLWQDQDPQVEHVRARLAETFGCGADEMALTRNASESLENCIFGLELKAGDEVIYADVDYPRMITTWKQRELREGIKCVQVAIDVPLADAQSAVEAYRKAITPRTRAMMVSHVVFVTGQIMPVRAVVALGRERNIPVIVDGAHAFAQLAFRRDDLDCDYYGVSLHKWLTAPIGAGFLYVRKDRIADLWPMMASVTPRGTDIRKFEEIGTHPAANKLAIAEALAFYHAIGPQRKAARLCALRDRWAKRLTADKRVTLLSRLEPQHTGGFATLRIDGVESHNKVAEYLWDKFKIFIVAVDYADGKACGLRVTPNVYTTPDEIDAFCTAIESVLARGGF
jgi:isopenicillin-N epimerase